MHSTRTSTALLVSVHAIAVYIGFQGKKEDYTVFQRLIIQLSKSLARHQSCKQCAQIGRYSRHPCIVERDMFQGNGC